MDLGGFFMPETGAANEKAKTLMGAKVPYRGGIPEASLGHRAELHPEAGTQSRDPGRYDPDPPEGIGKRRI